MIIKEVTSGIAYCNPSDAIVKCNCGSNAISVYFGASRNYSGVFTIRKVDSSANSVTIYPNGAETIDGAASVTLTTQNEYKTFVSHNGGWTAIDSYTANPTLGAVTATTVNKVTLTAPATGSTLTIADGKTLTASNSITIAGTDGKTLNIGANNVTLTTTGATGVTLPTTGTLATLAGAETFTNKVLTDAQIGVTIGAHDYAAGVVDWTLSAAELLKTIHKPTNASGPVNAIIAVASVVYVFINATGQALTVKTPAGTGVAITSGKTAIVMSDGTNVIALATQSA